MEKRRVRLEINGVVCGLITQESDEYMGALAEEVGALMREIQEASPYITREAAALTVALSYCDDLKKSGKRAGELQDRVDELEVEAEIWQEEKSEMLSSGPKEDPALLERVRTLETENTALSEQAGQAETWREKARKLEDENAALQKSLLAAEAAARQVPPVPEDRGEAEAVREKLKSLERENEKLKEALAAKPKEAPQASQAAAQPAAAHSRKNPLRYEDELLQEGIVSFFEKQ